MSSLHSSVTAGMKDLQAGTTRHQLWGFLAWRDIANRYQRSFIGPMWLTVTTSIFLLAVGFVYSRIFGVDITTYFPYLAAGFMTWVVLTTLLNDMALAYVGSLHYALNLNAPRSIYLYRVLARDILMAAHLLPIWVVVAVVFHIPVSWTTLLVIPGAGLSLGVIFCLGVVAAVASSRFRDVPMILASALQVLFFVTPVMWQVNLIPESAQWLLAVNPFVPLLDLVRQPLLGTIPSSATWGFGLGLLVVCAGLALAVYARYQRRITYWL